MIITSMKTATAGETTPVFFLDEENWYCLNSPYNSIFVMSICIAGNSVSHPTYKMCREMCSLCELRICSIWKNKAYVVNQVLKSGCIWTIWVKHKFPKLVRLLNTSIRNRIRILTIYWLKNVLDLYTKR